VRYLVDFLENKDIAKSKVYEYLKCSNDEAKILQYLTNELIEGNPQVIVLELLKDLFAEKNYSFLGYLPSIKSLIPLLCPI